MRQIVLDTETTGLEPTQGHRVIEIGCVEIVNRRVTRRHFHHYLNPEREIDAGAVEVHGITREQLRDKPRFREVVEEFLDFVRGAELVIHNAPFDLGFLDAELALLGEAFGRVGDYCTVFDTLGFARQLHPGQRNSLDALCRRYEVENAHRELHGALLDAELLAEVYLAMTGGQAALALDAGPAAAAETHAERPARPVTVPVVAPSPAEREAHRQSLARISEASGGRCLWQGDEVAGRS